MIKRVGAELPALSAVVFALSACGPTESEATQYLKEQGITVSELKKDGNVFSFSGKKGDDVCMGSLTLQKSIGTTTQVLASQCRRDTSACKSGAPAVCVQLADELYSRAKGFPEQAAGLYRTACTDKNGHACARAGEFEAITKNWSQVRAYFAQGCDLNDGDACTRLGFTELEGNGTEKSETKAVELFKKGCAASSLRGCRAAAGTLLDAKPVDPAALTLAEKVCNAKFEDGCFVLGMALFDLKRDYPTALNHLDAACNDETLKSRGMACNVAGAIVSNGLGMKKDPVRGLGYLEKGCAYDYAEGCSNAGKLYKKGSGTAPNQAKADEFFAKACKLGSQAYCAAK